MLTGSSQSSQYGPYFLLFLVSLTAHAMIRHRFMDSRLVLRTSVTYTLSLGAIAGMMWGLFTLWGLLWDADAYRCPQHQWHNARRPGKRGAVFTHYKSG